LAVFEATGAVEHPIKLRTSGLKLKDILVVRVKT